MLASIINHWWCHQIVQVAVIWVDFLSTNICTTVPHSIFQFFFNAIYRLFLVSWNCLGTDQYLFSIKLKAEILDDRIRACAQITYRKFISLWCSSTLHESHEVSDWHLQVRNHRLLFLSCISEELIGIVRSNRFRYRRKCRAILLPYTFFLVSKQVQICLLL